MEKSNESTNKSNILFPAVFKANGYSTEIHNNQYFAGDGVNFMVDKDLSDILYDWRNVEGNDDRNIIEEIDTTDADRLILIQLMGSHYIYSNQYPHDKFTYFKPDDYDSKLSEDQKIVLAHYDNSL